MFRYLSPSFFLHPFYGEDMLVYYKLKEDYVLVEGYVNGELYFQTKMPLDIVCQVFREVWYGISRSTSPRNP